MQRTPSLKPPLSSSSELLLSSLTQESEEGDLLVIVGSPALTPPVITPTKPTPDDNADTMPIDAWDGDMEKMSMQRFLWAFHRDISDDKQHG
jgi:hypothetical protein